MTAKTIPTIRASIAELQADLARVEAAGRPIVDTLPALAAQIEDLAWPYRNSIARGAAAAIAARNHGDARLFHAFNLAVAAPEFAVSAIAALLGTKILADLEAEIAAQAPACPAAIPDDERNAALASIRRRLRALERDEEALIVAERAAGNFVTRRADSDAAAVLGIPDGVLEEIGL